MARWLGIFTTLAILGKEATQLLPHFAEQSILQGFELCKRHNARLSIGFACDEVKHISFLILSDFRLGDVLENLAKGVAHLVVVGEQSKRLDMHLVEMVLREEVPCLVTGPAAVSTAVVYYRVENNGHATVLH